MGERGPARKPRALQAVDGERKSRKSEGTHPEPPVAEVARPPYLSAGAAGVWDELAPQLVARRQLTIWDVDSFAVLCEAISIHRRAVVLCEDGLLVDSYRGGVAKNPALQILRDSAATIRAFGREFGLTPGSRGGLAAGVKPDDPKTTRILTPVRKTDAPS